MDVYSAALVLIELLTGKPLIHQTDPWQALYRVAHEDLALPDDLGPGVDDGLRAILQRGMARLVDAVLQRIPLVRSVYELSRRVVGQPSSAKRSIASSRRRTSQGRLAPGRPAALSRW